MEDQFDTYATAASITILVLYHLYLYHGVFMSNKASVGGMMNNTYYWVKKHSTLMDAATATSSVQTFRNVNLVAVFVSGSAISAATGALDNYSSANSTFQEKLRALVFAVCLFCSGISWAQVLRIASHMGYMVGLFSQLNLLENKKDELDLPDPLINESTKTFKIGTRTFTLVEKHFHNVTTMLKQLFLYFHLGLRFIVVSVPFAYHSAGSIALLISTVVVVLFMCVYDYSLGSDSAFADMVFPGNAGSRSVKWEGNELGWRQKSGTLPERNFY